MKKSFNNKPLIPLFISIAAAICLLTTSYLIYNILLLTGFETLIRIGIILILIIIYIVLLFIGFNIIKNRNKTLSSIFIFTILLFTFLEAGAAYNIQKLYHALDTIKQKEIIYSTSLITLTEKNLKTIDTIKNIKIGIINDEHSIDGYIISQEIIKENKLAKINEFLKYDDFITMINALYKNEVQAIFVPTNYTSLFNDEDLFTDLTNETTIVITKEKSIKEVEKPSQTKITEPFSILIMGIDATSGNINTNANGDAIMIITFNPKLLNATILSIPRDTLVPIACKNNYLTKITHASWYGEKCMLATIEQLLDFKLDYYLKINFQGVVKLVEALNGIEVDVPIKFCEQNSKRERGSKQICLNKGIQRLNGEEALALTRNRYQAPGGDIGRSFHQQLVLKAILNEAKNIKNINQVHTILEVMTENIATNLTTNQILSLYNIGKDIIKHNKNNEEPFTFEQLILKTYSLGVYEAGNVLSTQPYYQGSLNDIIKAMKINLGLIKAKPIKNFTYCLSTPYQPTRIGEGPYYGETKQQVLPNFTNKYKNDAITWCEQHGYKAEFEIKETDENKVNENQILHQSIHHNTLLSRLNKNTTIVFTIAHKTEVNQPPPTTKTNCSLPENETHAHCSMPNFVNEKLEEVDKWLSNISNSIIVTKKEMKTNNKTDHLIIYEQSEAKGTKVTAMKPELIIKYYYYEEELETEQNISETENENETEAETEIETQTETD